MVNDADKFKAEDEKQKERISAKNGLESYCFNMKTTIEDDKVKDKISGDDAKAINDKCDDTIKWLDANQLAEVCIHLPQIEYVPAGVYRREANYNINTYSVTDGRVPGQAEGG